MKLKDKYVNKHSYKNKKRTKEISSHPRESIFEMKNKKVI